MAVKFQDYYQTLGVPRDAPQGDIRKAFRKLARQYHPDVNKQPEAEPRFKAVNEAYEVLGDPDKRKKYDELGSNWRSGQEFRAPPGWEEVRFDYGADGGRAGGFSFRPGEFSDFFEMFFGRRGGGPGRGGQFQGADIEDLFRRAQAGQARGPGGQAGGAGRPGGFTQPGGPAVEAEVEVSLEEALAGGTRRLELQLPTGERRTLEVKIPPGVHAGSKIRLKGQGGGGADLILTVRLAPHSRFEVADTDLVTDLPVAPWEAALGAKVNVPTLNGDLTVTVPPGSQTGQKLRLRGKGLPRSKDERGDLLARIKIVNPRKLSEAERRLFEQLRQESKFNPRG